MYVRTRKVTDTIVSSRWKFNAKSLLKAPLHGVRRRGAAQHALRMRAIRSLLVLS